VVCRVARRRLLADAEHRDLQAMRRNAEVADMNPRCDCGSPLADHQSGKVSALDCLGYMPAPRTPDEEFRLNLEIAMREHGMLPVRVQYFGDDL
jgi:hypothetical protein